MIIRMLAAALALAFFAQAAQAVPLIKFKFWNDLTVIDDYDDPNEDDVTQHLGLFGPNWIRGVAGETFSLAGDAFSPDCFKCYAVTVSGNMVEFRSLDPDLDPATEHIWFRFVFDRDLGGSVDGVLGAQFVSGSREMVFRPRSMAGTTTYSGPLSRVVDPVRRRRAGAGTLDLDAADGWLRGHRRDAPWGTAHRNADLAS